jgi:SAM-dependent methyltransferase
MTGDSRYVFAAEPDGSNERFSALAALYDDATKAYVERLGIESGWHCLEIGGGGGSIARWLAGRASTGRVVATDLEVATLSAVAASNLEVWRHDLACEPLPIAAFDLVHARLVLMHLGDAPAAMARLVSAVRPGGWLLVEEYEATPFDPLDHEFSPPKASLAFREAMERAKVDTRFGRRLPGLLRRHGLIRIGAEARAALWTGGGPGTRLMRANYLGLREAMLDTGLVCADEIDADVARLDDPDFVTLSPTMWTAWGQVR